MKKILLSTAAAIALIATTNSCGKVADCITDTSAVSTALNNFSSSATNANCVAAKNAMQTWLNNSNCTSDSAAKANMQTTLDSFKVICP